MSHRQARDRRRSGFVLSAVFILSLAAGGGLLFSQETATRQGTVEFSFGGRSVADPLFDAIYQPGGPIGGLGFTANLVSFVDFYFDLKVMVKSGLLSHSQDKTTFVLMPISLGIRASYPVSFLIPYAGAGFDYYAYLETNPIGTVLDNAKGGHLLAGFYLRLGKAFPILPFFRVKYALVKTGSGGAAAINLGGWEYGGGLAIAF